MATPTIAIKPASGQLGLTICYNPNAAQVYIQVFDTAKGNVVLGTTVPKLSIPIPPTNTGGFAMSPAGIIFANAISANVTTTATGSIVPGLFPDCSFGFN